MRLLPLIAVVLVAAGCSTTMRISRGELQADLARRFPVEADKRLVVVRAANPQIELPGGRDLLGVRLDLDAVSASGNSHLRGSARVEGRVEYVRAEHAFFLRDPRVTELVLLPPAGDGALARVVDHADHVFGGTLVEHAARAAIEQLLRTHPIYRLDARRSTKEAKAIRHLRSVHVDGQDLVLEVAL